MAIRGNITLTDAAATPVNHVFYPSKVQGQNGEVLLWRDRLVETMIGQNRLTLSQRPAGKQAKSTKVAWVLECPTLKQIAVSGQSSNLVLSHTNIGKVEFVFAEISTLQERKDCLAMLRDLIDEAIVTTQAHDLEFIW